MRAKINAFFLGLMLAFEPLRQSSILPPSSVVKIKQKNYRFEKRSNVVSKTKFNRTTMK